MPKVEENCSRCGKLFYIPDRENYAYKKYKPYYDGVHSFKWYCSWRCMRAEEREEEYTKAQRREAYAKRKALHR